MNVPATSAGQPLTIDAVTQRYGAFLAVDNVTLDIKAGELIALLGPSGCGKTTLLRIIAGFIVQSEGHVVIGEKLMDGLAPNRREVGIVFQNYALFPHMTIADNIAYGLAARGLRREAQGLRVKEMLALIRLTHIADRFPKQLSGGQQQRVALARALAVKPNILLLDEPFAALDKNLRLDMQIEIKRIQRLAGTTTILVTHDQEEALSMADRVAVLNQGRLEQYAAPTEVYDKPSSLFVNTFVGTANTLPGKLVALNGEAVVALDIGAQIKARAPAVPIALGDRVTVCLRPEHLRLADGGEGLAGIVEMGLPLGASIVHEVRTADGRALKVTEPRAAGAQPRASGSAVRVQTVGPQAISIFPATASAA
ncbi:MAG: ABC transporter ATP-binding protein [Alphaproteobacteria bacterium]|nr:ABC transporter ATP-binding protein [Alphaproteobacteria bacterium]